MDNTEQPIQTPTPAPSQPASSTPQGVPSISTPAEVIKPKKTMKMVLIIVGVLLVLALLGGGIYYFMNMNNNASPAANQRTTTLNTNPVPKVSTTQVDPLEQDLNSVDETPV